MLSGGTNDSISAPGADWPTTQSNTLPLILASGTVGPVQKNVAAPALRTFPRRSARPLVMITVYGVLARHPCEGLTPIASRCQDASGTPSRGEIRKRSPSVVTEGGRSDTTSSKRNKTSFGLTPMLPESGLIATIWGAATSTGPPGGMPGEAHAEAISATGISRRKALSPFQRAARFSVRFSRHASRWTSRCCRAPDRRDQSGLGQHRRQAEGSFVPLRRGGVRAASFRHYTGRPLPDLPS